MPLDPGAAPPYAQAMEWQAPAVVLGIRPYGESGALVSLLTEAHGRHAGLAKGGASRAQAPVWQPGNLVEARWVGRLADQLGAVSAEMVHPAAALAMADPMALALLSAACALAETALPDRQPHPRCFHGLVALLARLPGGALRLLPDYIRWEALLLEEIGYGDQPELGLDQAVGLRQTAQRHGASDPRRVDDEPPILRASTRRF